MIVLGVSLVFLVALYGLVPFGFSAGWSEYGLGTSLVFTRPDASAPVGSTVAGPGEVGNGVVLFSVTEVVKESGVTYYRSLEKGSVSGQEILVRAGEHGRVALLTLPFVGSWARALEQTIGLMALVGAPLTMLVMNGLLLLGSKFVFAASYVEQGAKQFENRRRQALQRKEESKLSAEVYEEGMQDEYVTILKPFGQRYGL